MGVPAQSRENKSQPHDQVMLEVTENHDWLTDLVMSDSKDSGSETIETSHQSSKQSKATSRPLVQPVLKAAGTQGEANSMVYRSKRVVDP